MADSEIIVQDTGDQLIVEVQSTTAVDVTVQDELEVIAVEVATGVPGPQNLYVQPTNPTMVEPGLWVQTGLDPNGEGITFWIEDGQ